MNSVHELELRSILHCNVSHFSVLSVDIQGQKVESPARGHDTPLTHPFEME